MTVVGIGASAGGLAALRAFFASVPADTELAFVVVVHLAPDHESLLAEILQPHVALPVQQVNEDTPLEPGRIYVIPPGGNLSAVDTHLRLSPIEAQRGERAPIDHFFRTLAQTHDGHSVAVVLTGTGTDGTLGVREIKECNGLTIAQDPDEAEFDGMPRSAIASGAIDRILPLAEIFPTVERFVATTPRVPASTETTEDEQRALLQRVFAHVNAETGRDFSQYKGSTVLRRIVRRMQLAHIEELAAYVEVLHDHPDEVRELADDLLINVTQFFRDSEVFEALATDVLPGLFEGKRPEESVRVWSVGCATGEEAYSLAILLTEEVDRRAARGELSPQVQVFASDLHEPSLARARRGVFPGDIEADLTPERLHRFFRRGDSGFQISQSLRELVVFAPHNLLADPPFSRLDLVSCRNLLIYLKRGVQREVIELFHYAIRPAGALVLGMSETVESRDLFQISDKEHGLYRRRNVPAPDLRLPVFPVSRSFPRAAFRDDAPDDRLREKPTSFGPLHHRAVELYAPPSLLVSPDDRVVHSSDRAGQYLHHGGGEPTANVFRIVREELLGELRSALRVARDSHRVAKTSPLALDVDGPPHRVVVEVRPLSGYDDDGFCLVVFDGVATSDPVDATGPPTPEAGKEHPDVSGLRSQLDIARHRLQAVLAEDEASRQDLQSANEELQSANEELRSTLEELETSKEELQSMNEELQTVNQENRHKVDELAQLTGDLTNLMAATEIATLFLDRQLRILRFTPRIRDLFNARPSDQGRPLTDLTHRLGYDGLHADASAVLDSLVPVEREIQDHNGRWYLTRILPYRSADDRIEGVVVTFVDITSRVVAESDRRESEEQFRALVTASAQMVWTTDADGLVVDDSPSWRAFTGQTTEEWLGWGWIRAVHPDEQDEAVVIWQSAVAEGRPTTFDLRIYNAQSGQYHWTSVRAVPLRHPDGSVRGWVGMNFDVSEQREAAESLRALNETLERRIDERTRDATDQEARVRELARALTLAEQAERERIAYLLHDDLQQVLHGAQFQASLDETDTVKALLKRAAQMASSLSHELSPPILHGGSVAELLDWLVDLHQEMYGLSVAVDLPSHVSVTEPHLRVLIYQILRELLFNVSKHADTSEARVTARILGHDGAQSIRLVVEDDGVGLDPAIVTGAESSGSHGLGLTTIRKRVELVGGRVSADAPSGGGTRVTVDLPMLTTAA